MSRTVHDERQLPLVTPATAWVPPTAYPSLQGFKRIALDTETHDPGLQKKIGSSWALGDGRLLGFTVATETWSRYYPLTHVEGNVEDPDKALRWLASELSDYPGEIVGQKLDYDLGWLGRSLIKPLAATFHDCMYAEALLDEHKRSYSLDAHARTYGLALKDTALLREAVAAYGGDPREYGAHLHRLPARFVGAYAERDGALPLEVAERQRALLARDQLEGVTRLEMALLPLHVAMRRRGVRVDPARVETVRARLTEQENLYLDELHNYAGFRVDIWAGASVARACRTLGLRYETTALDAPSFQAGWLEEQEHPFFAALRRARVYSKARGTFVEALVTAHLAGDGRLHPEWHPLRAEEKGGTVSGRYSCSEPSLHQIPARDDEVGPLIRSLFVPEEGERWFVFDVSQQEPRFTVHYAAVAGMAGAEAAVALINANPRLDYHQMVADLTGLPRKTAKVINLARAYGAGGAKLCRQMGLPTGTWVTPEGREVEVAGDEGRRILNQYRERFPFIGQLSERCQALAEERGWIRTYAGRLCRFPLWEPKGWGFRGTPLSRAAAEERWGTNLQRSGTHKAMNRLIQGSAADQLKLAMLAVWRETGVVPLLQVHDEVDCSLPDDPALVRRVDELIRESVQLRVPLLTDIDAGASWGEAERWSNTP